AALLVAHQAVAGLHVLHGGGVVAPDVLDEVERIGPGETEPAHVADVEHAGGGADGVVLLDDSGVLHGHEPAAELDHASAVRDVPAVQGRLQQRHEATPRRSWVRERSYASDAPDRRRAPRPSLLSR